MKTRFNTSKPTVTSKNIAQSFTKGKASHKVRQLLSVLAVFIILGVALSACTSKPAMDKGTLGYVQGFLGGVVADEPRAALVGRDILASGGSAADAATAMSFALAVTLPSRAGLGGDGACVAFDAKSGTTEVVDFTAPTPARGSPPITIPANPRGFFALQARHGRLLWREVVVPGEQLARFGFPASRALVQDLRATPDMRALFVRKNTAPVREGDILKQPDLATTLGLIRARGVGPFYMGPFANTLIDGVKRAGGALTRADLRRYKPRLRPGVRVEIGNDVAYFAPAPTGAAMAGTMFATVQKNDRFKGADDATRTRILAQYSPPQTSLSSAQRARAGTAFAAVDQRGNAVSCAVSMNTPFGTGRVAQGTGVVLAAAPGAGSAGAIALVPMLAVNENSREFKFAAAASGGVNTPHALAGVAARVLLAKEPLKTALAAARGNIGNGPLVNAISCPGGLPGKPDECQIGTDPRGVGLAAGSLK